MNGCVYRTADNQCQKYSDPIRNTMSWCVGNGSVPCGWRCRMADELKKRTNQDCNVGEEETKMPYCPNCGAKMDGGEG